MSNTPPDDRALPGSNPSSPFPPPVSRPHKKRKTNWLWPILILAVAGIGVVYIVSHKDDSADAKGGRRGYNPFTPVNAVAAQRGDMPIYIDALGTVTPTQTVTVRSQINGVLQSVNFTEGQLVHQGQVLAQVDPRPYQAALQQALGSLARDQASLAAAKVDLNRYKTLLAQDSISQQQVDTQAATVGQLEGTVQTDQAAVQTQRLNLTYARITAPISGRLGLRQVDAGNYVTSGDSNGIVAITQQSPINVTFAIPEAQIAEVEARFNTDNKLQVTALSADQSKTLATGTLASLDNLIDTTTGTLRAKAKFDNADNALFPSQFVNVRLLVDTMHNAIIVPSSAILHGPDGLFVYVADKRGAVHVTNVTTGPSANDNTAVLSGLEPGQMVVTDGTDRLREGACVALPGQTPQGGNRHGKGGAASASASSSSEGGFFAHLFGGKSDAAKGKGGKGGNYSPCGGGHAGAGGSSGNSSAGHGYGARASAGQGSDQSAAQGAPSDAGTGSPAGMGGNGGGNGNGGGRMKAMLAQLNLTPDQQTKIDAILAQARQNAGDDPDARRAAMQAAMPQIQAVLTPAQIAQLKALRAQAQARAPQSDASN